MKYFKIWKQLSNCAISSYLSNRIDAFSYLAGKLVRFGFFLLFIFSIFNYTDNLVGYSKYEVILFFLTFNLLDVLASAFFRGIYLFQNDIRLGNFDFTLIKPINSLFYTISRLTDILDMIFLVPIIAFIIFTINKLNLDLSFINITLYLLLIFNGTIITLGIHIISASITMRTMESNNVIWLYRESMTIGRFPPEIYSVFIQTIFTFIMPVIIIVAFPVKVLLGVLSIKLFIFSLFYSIIFFSFSIVLWKISLKKYSSASS